MTLSVIFTTPASIGEVRRTPVAGTFSSLTGQLFAWAEIGDQPQWHVIRLEDEFAPRYAEHSTADTTASGSFSFLPLGGWEDTPIPVTLVDTAAPATPILFKPAEQEALDRFEVLFVRVTGVTPLNTLIWVKVGELPWEWHLVYDGVADEFSPLFAELSFRSGNDYTIAPVGGWWQERVELDVLAVI